MPAKTSKASSNGSTKAKAAPSRADRARAAAETAVDLPVGAVLEAGDRVAELVEPFTARAAAEKELRSYGRRLRRTIKRTERRGTTARRRATSEARKTRSKVERETRRRRRSAETTLRRNRDEVEQRVRKAVEEQTSRAQSLVDQVGDQLASLR